MNGVMPFSLMKFPFCSDLDRESSAPE